MGLGDGERLGIRLIEQVLEAYGKGLGEKKWKAVEAKLKEGESVSGGEVCKEADWMEKSSHVGQGQGGGSGYEHQLMG
jgi:hypothetical protein